MITNIFLLVLGFAFLIKGADFLVDGASSLAKKLKVSALVIGLTVVAFGTSAPELIVNIFASARGNADIAIGNILGSNIANILLILGLASIIYPLSVKKGTVWKEIPLALLAVIMVALMANDAIIDNGFSSVLTRIDGFALIAFFIIFIYYTFGIAKAEKEEGHEIKARSSPISFLMIAGGLVGLTIGGKIIVDSAVAIAHVFSVSEALIGLTIVAVGTSLPELAICIAAVLKKNSDIAVGNIVGSNIFNLFFILGTSAIISPLPLSLSLNFDIWALIIATFMLFAFMFIGKRRILKRWQGMLFMTMYFIYLTCIVIRK
ncbi:MAG: calcium/sodium antiporter [Candidatus Nealsonbacteria bacterium]